MPYDPDELGLDLQHAKALPECMACRKKSDGAVICGDGTVLCGTHFDEWINRRRFGGEIAAADFAKELREGRYCACWEATIE